MNEWILRLISLIVTVASPELRARLMEWINTLEAQAKKTANPWDDVLVGLLKTLVLGDKK